MGQPQVPWAVLAPVVVSRHVRTHWSLPHLRAPRTFNEKVLHRMLFDRRDVLSALAGKLEARAFVQERVGEGPLPQLIGTACDADGLRRLDLPERFVVKANHLSGRVRFARRSDDLDALGLTVAGWCRRSQRLEWGYRGTQAVAVVEPFLGEGDEPPADYKLWCYDGEVHVIAVDTGRFGESHARTLFDTDWRPYDVRIELPAEPRPPRPPGLDAMVELARALSAGLDFVRVDLYDLGGRAVFGELTAYPGRALCRFDPPSADLAFGRLWTLPAR